MAITHTKVTVLSDDPAYDVSANAWNDDHAVPAEGFTLGSGGPSISAGSGSPEGVVTAEPGSLYLDTTGGLYVKASGSGNTGWVDNLTV